MCSFVRTQLVRSSRRVLVRAHQPSGLGQIHTRLCRRFVLQNVRLPDRPRSAFGPQRHRRARTQSQKVLWWRYGWSGASARSPSRLQKKFTRKVSPKLYYIFFFFCWAATVTLSDVRTSCWLYFIVTVSSENKTRFDSIWCFTSKIVVQAIKNKK